MKKVAIYFLSVFLVLSPMTYSPKVEASGIPTVDIAGLIQELMAYAQQIADFSEQLYQSAVINNEYIIKLKQLEQIYREYEHTLNQIKGMADFVNDAEWRDLLAAIELDFPLNPLDSHWSDYNVNVYTENGVVKPTQVVSKAFRQMNDLDDNLAIISSSMESGDARSALQDQVRKTYLKSKFAVRQKKAVGDYTDVLDKQKKALSKLEGKVNVVSSGEENDLKVMQMMLQQNSRIIESQQIQNRMSVVALDLANQEANERRALEAYALDMHLLDLKEISEQEPYKAKKTTGKKTKF